VEVPLEEGMIAGEGKYALAVYHSATVLISEQATRDTWDLSTTGNIAEGTTLGIFITAMLVLTDEHCKTRYGHNLPLRRMNRSL
jgi:hypothetical protein